MLVNNAESDATKARAAKRRNLLDAAEAKGFYSKPSTTTTTAGGAPREARDSFLNHYIPYKNNNLPVS